MNKHIVVIEDNVEIAEEMVDFLSQEGFQVSSSDTVEDAEKVMRQAPADLIIVDIGLPGKDGLTFAREVRANSDVGVVMVTGRINEIDRVIGLEVGADDYICKPFSPREMLARVRSVLRRTEGNRYPNDVTTPEIPLVFEFVGWNLNTFTRELHDRSGASVHLTTAEYELLRTFLEGPNRVYTRDYLSYQVFRHEASPVSRAIDGLISRLRKKFDQSDAADTSIIKTVRGAGYIFTAKVIILKA